MTAGVYRPSFGSDFVVKGDGIPDCRGAGTRYCPRCKKSSRILEIVGHKVPWFRCCGRAA